MLCYALQDELFGVRRDSLATVGVDNWLMLLMRVMIMEYMGLLMGARRFPLRWGLREALVALRSVELAPPHSICDDMICDAMRCDAMRCDAMRCDAMRCDAMRCDAMRCDARRRHRARASPLTRSSTTPSVGHARIERGTFRLCISTFAEPAFGVRRPCDAHSVLPVRLQRDQVERARDPVALLLRAQVLPVLDALREGAALGPERVRDTTEPPPSSAVSHRCIVLAGFRYRYVDVDGIGEVCDCLRGAGLTEASDP
jgi:pentapeptide MXKDX repeat protein